MRRLIRGLRGAEVKEDMKRLLILALACVLLAGCMPLTSELHSIDQPVDMPRPTAQDIDPAIGDAVAAQEVEAALYYPSDALQELVPVNTALTVYASESLTRRLVEALLAGPGVDGARRVAPEGTAVRGVWRSGDTAVVDLSVDARSMDNPRQMFLMRAAIARTLCGVGGIRYVDVLVAGRAESPLSVPFGAVGVSGETVLTEWTQAQAEAERAGADDFSIERTAVLYVPARDTTLIIPRARRLTFARGDYLTPLLDALSDAGGLDPVLGAILPDTESPVKTEIVSLEDGRRVARLYFGGNLSAILEKAHLSAWQMYASLTCTLTGFIPALDGIQVYVGEGQLTRVATPDGERDLGDGVMTRTLFEHAIGTLETIYMTAKDGTLRPLSRSVSPEDAVSPRMLLAPLFDGPAAWESGVSRVIPDGLSPDDLLGIRVENGEAVLNFSAAFYARCQRLTAQQERNLVYAVVNTITGRDDVTAVRFQIEGATVDTLVHEISLLGPLVRNPGLISAAPQS